MEMNTEEFTTFINITANMSKTIGEQEEQMKQLNTRVEKNDAEMQRVLSENEALLRRVAELEEKLNEANRQILELTQKNVAKNVNINILNVFMSEGIIPLTAQLLDANRKPRLSENKAAVLADVMADCLNLSPRWKPFEELWEIEDLCNKRSKALNQKYFADLQREFKDALK